MEWLMRKAQKMLWKEAAVGSFAVSCALAKVAPLVEGGDYRTDAILYMLFAALTYFIWTYWN